MKILMINTLYGIGSTGKIVKQISYLTEKRGFECLVAHRYEEKNINYPENVIPVSNWFDCHIHNRLSRLTMLRGCFSIFKTISFFKKVNKFNPDMIHLHNIHGNFINLSLLFRYIKKHKVKVVWTLHDCWPLTGNCKHFGMVGCDKWKTGCGNCPQKMNALADISSYMYKKKQKMFSDIEDMTFVTPSVWLADLVRSSSLKKYPVTVINNGIDLTVFKPTDSSFRQDNCLEGKKIILGVAFGWDERKGLDIFLKLASDLPDDYRIVLVGTNDSIDKLLPHNIVSVHRTTDQQELAAIYTAADVFLNPTREENYPTVNMEALACGTPVVTFATGGSAEIIDDTCGIAIEQNNCDDLAQKIIDICENNAFSKEACLKKAQEHNMNDKFDEYIRLYEELI